MLKDRDEGLSDKLVEGTVKSEGGNLMFWGGMAWDGVRYVEISTGFETCMGCRWVGWGQCQGRKSLTLAKPLPTGPLDWTGLQLEKTGNYQDWLGP